MDYDSSTKFISSLAKFLQSLCNGYVEFDNGVEVIGHIYLSVDTGKKIDYILNEKVCKTDENSVTFISNSFHAQPAEKPKPNAKKGRNDQTDEKTDNVVEIDNDNTQVEPKSTNLGTIPRNSIKNPYSPSQRHGKRPFSPHSKSNSSPGSKRSKNESQEYSAGIISDEGNLSTSSPAPDPLRGFTQGSVSLPSESNFSQSYDQGFHPSVDNSFADDSEERDIKPTMDTDVTFVKEEFTPSSSQIEDDRNQGGVDSSYSSLYHSNQSYSGEGPSNQTFGQQNSRLSFGGAGERSDVYDPGMRSHMEGNGSGADASVFINSLLKQHQSSSSTPMSVGKLSKNQRPLIGKGHLMYSSFHHSRYPLSHILPKRYTCSKCNQSFSYPGNLSRHRKACEGNFDIKFTQGDSANWPISPLQSDRRVEPSWFLGDDKSIKYGKSFNHLKTCRKCGFTSRDNLEMNIHKKKCTGKRHLTCCVCSKVLSRYDALAEHLRGIHGIGSKVACRFCGKGFKYKPQVYQHQITCPQKPDNHATLTVNSSLLPVSDSSFICPTKSPPPHFTADVKPIISFPYDPKA